MTIDDLARGLQESIAEPSQSIRPATTKEVRRFLLHENETIFQTGELVVWRDGMADRSTPAYGQVCIVTSVFNPIHKQHPAQGDILVTQDIALGFIIKDSEGRDAFTELPYDSRRFKHLEDEDGNDRSVHNEEDDEESPQG